MTSGWVFRRSMLNLSKISLAILACSMASAAVNALPRAKDSSSSPAITTITADAPNARLAGLIASVSGVPKIIRNRGIASVTRISTGVYCIKPAASTVDPSKSIAIVSVEFYWSLFNESLVQWASQGSGCGSGQFAVYTFEDRNLTAKYSFTNNVGFSIYVP